MLNTELNVNGVGIGGTGNPHDKQLPVTMRKTALRDVQNENLGSIQKQHDNLLSGGLKINHDAITFSGNKRLTPEQPSSSQGLSSLAYHGTNENVMNARRRFELELGRGKLQNNIQIYSDGSQSISNGQLPSDIPQKPSPIKDNNLLRTPVSRSSNSPLLVSNSGSSVPNSTGKNSSISKSYSQVARIVDIKSTNDQLRTERFIKLQKFLTQCEVANQRECMLMLLPLSPIELSKHAVELERRAIQLTMDEGVEMQRMKALNILGKPSVTNNLLQS